MIDGAVSPGLIPLDIDDNIFPAERLEKTGDGIRGSADFVLADGSTVTVPAVLAHGRALTGCEHAGFLLLLLFN